LLEDSNQHAETCEYLILKIAEVKVTDSFLVSQISICTEKWTECEILVKNFSSDSKEEGAAVWLTVWECHWFILFNGIRNGESKLQVLEIRHCRYVVNLEANRNCSSTALSPPH
jgi:hypothetical protein